METNSRNGLITSWSASLFKVGLLALFAVFASAGQGLAWYTEFCISGEKYVSTTGPDGPFVRNSVSRANPATSPPSVYQRILTSIPGTNNVPAATVNIPVDYFGDQNKVFYKFVIKNCGIHDMYNVRLDDCIDQRSTGAAGFLDGTQRQCVADPRLVPESPPRIIATKMVPGQSVTVTSADFTLDPISSIDVCDKYGRSRTNGIVRNNLRVKAEGDFNKDGVGDTTYYSDDLNVVQCKEYTPAPAALGDRVWRDINGANGIQDCQDTNNNGIIGDAGDVGAECGTGIPGVTVNLVNCQNPASILRTTQTDARGFYLFDHLNPGQYCVQFDITTVPAGTCTTGLAQFTTQNVGSNDAVDSDANPNTGITPPVTLISGQTNRTVDAGVSCKACPVGVDKKCVVETAPTGAFVCSDAKPIDSLTMIWTGQGGIYIKAWKGTPGGTLLSMQGPIATGEKVTVTGMGGSPLDQTWEIFSGMPDPTGSNKVGQSIFHISCSDVDMNGPEDCGKLEGNAKTTGTSLINLWRFDGMSGSGQTLSCTPASTSRQDNCSFTTEPSPSCQSLRAKPKTLSFRYSGSDCSASRNSQAADKWFCSGVPGTSPTVSVVKDPGRISVSPTTPLRVGDIVTVSAIGSDMGSEIQLQVGGQSIKIHTSCSQPLAVGDVFGSLELVQFNGHGAGARVTYFYDVRNNGTMNIDITSLLDDQLGELLQQPAPLSAGGVLTVEKSAFISQTTTNQVTATARIAGTGTVCGQARDQLTVAVTQPTCDVAVLFDSLGDASAKFKVKNTSSTMATLDTFTLRFPASYGAIKEIKLDGTIFKSSSAVPAVGSGVTISRWTNPDISKRQLDPGETRTLEVLFTMKGSAGGWVGMTNLGGMTFKEGCQAAFPTLPPCQFGKPTALEFQYTGESCSASSNDQAADKWSCSGNPAGAQPVRVVMTKDAGLVAVTLKNDADGDGRIDVGDTFLLRRTDGREFAAETLFNIVNGSTLQSLKIHTSCSQPLNIGDQFGSVILRSFQQKP